MDRSRAPPGKNYTRDKGKQQDSGVKIPAEMKMTHVIPSLPQMAGNTDGSRR